MSGHVASTDDLTVVIARLTELGCRPHERGPGRWVAICPAHTPKLHRSHRSRANLAITANKDRILLHCFGGCHFQAIVEALALDNYQRLGSFSRSFSRCERSLDNVGFSYRRLSCDQLLDRFHSGDLIPAKKIGVAPLPKGAGKVMRAVYEDFVLLTGLRRAVNDKRPIPYAGAWAAERLGMHQKCVARALKRLCESGVLKQRGKWGDPSQRKRWTRCYELVLLPEPTSDVEVGVGLPASAVIQPAPEWSANLHGMGVAESVGTIWGIEDASGCGTSEDEAPWARIDVFGEAIVTSAFHSCHLTY